MEDLTVSSPFPRLRQNRHATIIVAAFEHAHGGVRAEQPVETSRPTAVVLPPTKPGPCDAVDDKQPLVERAFVEASDGTFPALVC